MALDPTIGGSSADTYATLVAYRAYVLDTYNVTLGDADAASEAHLREAVRHIDGSYMWIGDKVARAQKRAWPRYTTKLIDGWSISSETIPSEIADAQCELAYRISLGATPSANIEGGTVKRERVDVIETEYMDGTGRDRAVYPAVDALIGPYHKGKASGRSGSVSVVRA